MRELITGIIVFGAGYLAITLIGEPSITAQYEAIYQEFIKAGQWK